jgi:hypothetical protein
MLKMRNQKTSSLSPGERVRAGAVVHIHLFHFEDLKPDMPFHEPFYPDQQNGSTGTTGSKTFLPSALLVPRLLTGNRNVVKKSTELT